MMHTFRTKNMRNPRLPGLVLAMTSIHEPSLSISGPIRREISSLFPYFSCHFWGELPPPDGIPPNQQLLHPLLGPHEDSPEAPPCQTNVGMGGHLFFDLLSNCHQRYYNHIGKGINICLM